MFFKTLPSLVSIKCWRIKRKKDGVFVVEMVELVAFRTETSSKDSYILQNFDGNAGGWQAKRRRAGEGLGHKLK